MKLFAAALLLAAAALQAGSGLPRADPESVGMSAKVLDAGVDLFRQAVEKDELRGAVILVARRGKAVVHEAMGWRDFDRKIPFEPDTLFRMASNTKAVVAAATLILVQEGKLSLDDNVRLHLASFDNYRAGGIKVRHLLSHTSGLRISEIFLKPLLSPTSLQAEVARLGEIGAAEPVGESFSYNNPGYNTLGALIEVRSGMLLETFLRQRIYEPLGMSDVFHLENMAPNERMAVVYAREKNGAWSVKWKPQDPNDYPFVRASGGMITTAADYVRFCQMFLNGGELDGKRILSEESVKAATTIQTPGPKDNYGFGWHVDSEGKYSHGGSDGTFAWIDPKTGVIGLVLTQSQTHQIPLEQFQRVVAAAIYAE